MNNEVFNLTPEDYAALRWVQTAAELDPVTDRHKFRGVYVGNGLTCATDGTRLHALKREVLPPGLWMLDGKLKAPYTPELHSQRMRADFYAAYPDVRRVTPDTGAYLLQCSKLHAAIAARTSWIDAAPDSCDARYIYEQGRDIVILRYNPGHAKYCYYGLNLGYLLEALAGVPLGAFSFSASNRAALLEAVDRYAVIMPVFIADPAGYFA